MKHFFILILLQLFIGFSLAQQGNHSINDTVQEESIFQNIPWDMKEIVSDTLYVNSENIELCKTLFGRKEIIKAFDSITIKDLRFQWLGLKEQDTAYNLSYDDFLMEHVQNLCKPIPGGQRMIITDTNRMIFYNKGPIFCESRNTGGGTQYDCKEKHELILPNGWQICRFTFESRKVRHGRYRFSPIFIPNETNKTNRYKGHNLYLTGHGDVGNPSSVYITNIVVYAIKSDLDDNYRRACNCEMENLERTNITTPGPSRNPTYTGPVAIVVNKGDGNGQFLQPVYIKNLISSPISVTYKRTNSQSGKYSVFTKKIDPLKEEFIGYNCHTSSYTSLCSEWYYTQITNIEKL